jgi:hypothetical protein
MEVAPEPREVGAMRENKRRIDRANTERIERATAERPETPVEAMGPRAPGHVDIATPNGWAEVSVAGRSYGRTPLRIELPAGPATIELRPNGTGAPIRVPVEVPSGGGARVIRALPTE